MSEDERNDVEDHDLGSKKELAKLFSTHYSIQHEQAVSLKKQYVLHLSQFPRTEVVAAGLSGRTVLLHDIATGKVLETNSIELSSPKETNIAGIKCVGDNELYVCSSMGEVLLFDIRTNEQVNKFWDSESDKLKPYSAFDLNSNGRMICVGTEETRTDVFLCFFDVRQNKMVGGYWDSHENDISQVKFHPTNPNLLLSGSLDGLINYFDISELNEEDAIQGTFNTERSVCKLNWHKNNLISCITDSDEVLFYDLAEMELVEEFSRATVTERMRRNCSMECSLIDCHNIGPNGDQIAMLAASNFNKGECLRTLTYDAASKSLGTHGDFTGNRQIVRCSHYNDTHNYFLTGGEQGIITLWRAGQDAKEPSDAATAETAGKAAEVGKSKKTKAHKSKPY